MHLVDQVHLEAPPCRCVLRVLDHLAHIVHAGVAGSVDFQQVHETAGIDRRAHRAFATGISRFAALAIQRFREDARNRGLAHAAGAGEQIGMVHAAGVERIGERAHDMLLPDEFGELAGAPFAREYLIGHALLPWGERRLCQVARGKSVTSVATAARGPERRRPCQPHPGTRIIRYRCSLPGLAEFTNYRRGGTDRATIDFDEGTEPTVHFSRQWLDRRVRTGGEGGIRTRDTGISRIHTFQACSFNHSDTSPHAKLVQHPSTPGGMVRPVLGLTPRLREGPACGCPCRSWRTS